MKRKDIVWVFIVAAVLGVGIWAGLIAWRNEQIAMHGDSEMVTNLDTLSPSGGAQDSQILDLADGQMLDMVIMPVQKTIAGRSVTMLSYNGSLPGPTIRVSEGSEITINLKNNGNIPTTLHPHGVRVDNAFDGVPSVTQKEIAPGESFVYKLKFSDPGIFWYHPHVRTDYALESGLYGNIIVVPKDNAYWSPVNREIPVMLDDIALDKKGILPFDEKVTDHALMGRFGNVMFVNGQTEYAFDAKQGEVVRLYLTNAANTRLFNVAIPGAKMKLVGADMGRYAKEEFVEDILIAPGERRVVDVFFEKPGAYEMRHRTPGKEYTLAKITASSEKPTESYEKAFSVLRTNETVSREMKRLMTEYLRKTPDKSLALSLEMHEKMQQMMNLDQGHMGGGHMMHDGSMMNGADMGMGDDGDAYEWEDTMPGMNSASNSNTIRWKFADTTSGKGEREVDNWTFSLGDKVKIRIFNDPRSIHPMQHPIHFHGQRFMILATNGQENQNPVWQDTALIGKGDMVDILLDASNPGVWMAHCHILEHAESGMMFSFSVKS